MAQDRQSNKPPTGPNLAPPPQDLVRDFLKAQNLEAIKRVGEAVDLYEQAVRAGFDSAGPYDRLIAIYSGRSDFSSLARVASAALEHVRTFEDKRAFYARMRDDALASQAAQPDPRGAEF